MTGETLCKLNGTEIRLNSSQGFIGFTTSNDITNEVDDVSAPLIFVCMGEFPNVERAQSAIYCSSPRDHRDDQQPAAVVTNN